LNQSKSEVIRGHVQLLRWERERRARVKSESENESESEEWERRGFLYTFLMESIEEIWTLLCIFATWILSIEN
jgi:Arc/MetJ-type ribon-helix-helix transcriptional regulator